MTKCAKCNYESENNKIKNQIPLCKICYSFSPNNKEKLKKYTNEKIDWKILETFRNKEETKKSAMIKKASLGKTMSRAPFGYKIENKKLIKADNFREVEEIFEKFLNENISLTKLAKKYNLSVNGIKKILTNFTYIGKIRFNNEIYQGNHEPIISSTLFNHVQNKIEKTTQSNT